MLRAVIAKGWRLALATNKRRAPTALILESLGWQDRFAVVETVDSRPPAPRTKAQMLRDILTVLSPSAAVYLGDTTADVEAARQVGLPCILASWGAGPGEREPTTTFVLRPEEVVHAFAMAVTSQPTAS
jgi:phosphoglycolate phosphatase